MDNNHGTGQTSPSQNRRDGQHLKKLSIGLPLENSKWTKYLEAGTFDEEKALSTVGIDEKTIKAISPKTFADLEGISTPTFATLRKYQNEALTAGLIENLVYELKDSFSFNRTLSEVQCGLLSEMILEDYYHFTIADLKLCFREGIKGRYGNLFQTLDVTTVYGWLEQYLTDKANALRRIKESREKEAEKQVPVNREAINEIQKMLKEKIIDKKTKPKTSFIYPTIEAWCKDKGRDLTATIESIDLESSEKWKSMPEELKILMDKPAFLDWSRTKFLVALNKNNT